MKVLRVRLPGQDQADAPGRVMVPWPGMEHPASGSGPVTGNASPLVTAPGSAAGLAAASDVGAVTVPAGSGVMRALGSGTAAVASRGAGAAGRALAVRAGEPGSIVHAVWHCRPKTMAAHHRDIPGIGLGRGAEIQQHTLGKALKVSGTALSALGDSVAAQWVVIAVAAYVVFAFVFLVL